MVKCQLCGKSFKQLTSHLRTHGVSCNEYKEQFPDAQITSKELLKRLRKRMLGGQARTMGNKAKGCKKPNFSKQMLGNKRGLGTDRSDEIDRYRNQALKQHAEGNFGEWTEERRKRQANITAERWRNGSLRHVWQPKWQIQLTEYLNSKEIKFETEYVLPEDRIANGYRLSKPFDFFFPEQNLLVELNGCFWHGCKLCYDHHHIQDRVIKNDQEKFKIAKASGYALLTIWEHDKDNLFILIERALKEAGLFDA